MLTGFQRATLLRLMSLAEVTGLAVFSWEPMWGWEVQAASLEGPGLWWGQLEGNNGTLLLVISLGGHCAPVHGGPQVTVKAEATRPPTGQAGSGTMLLPPYFIDEGKSQSWPRLEGEGNRDCC